MDGGRQRTQQPIVTGTSVVALKYAGGVLMAADTLGSYGSLARFTDQRRISTLHGTTLIGAGGDFSDFQHLQDKLSELEVYDFNQDDGCDTTAPEAYHYLQRLLYQRRNKFDPLWNTLLVGGLNPETQEPFLGQVNMIGLAFEGNFLATGFGHHFATPLLRKNWRADLTENEARALLTDCMRVCLYRDTRTINRVQFAKVDEQGTHVAEPVALETKWDFEQFQHPHAQHGGSW